MARRAAVFLGLAAGAVVGWFAAQQQLVQHREDLFSQRPMRRFAALGTLAAREGVETVRLLRDYLEWERQPMLRRRAAAIVRRMEAVLG